MKRIGRMDDPDHTHSSSRLISASSARIYRACVEAESLAKWLPPKGAKAAIEHFSAREGDSFKIVLSFDRDVGKSSVKTDVVLGRFLKLIPCREIVQAIEFV